MYTDNLVVSNSKISILMHDCDIEMVHLLTHADSLPNISVMNCFYNCASSVADWSLISICSDEL